MSPEAAGSLRIRRNRKDGTLVERWVAAVQACHLDSVLRDHADETFTLDVPPFKWRE